MTRIYKILSRAEWTAAERAGSFLGSAVDLADGFIHFSTGAQAAETARRYFKDLTDPVVLEVEADDLGADLRWEPSRGGDLFPHLYDVLRPGQVRAVTEAPLGPDGFPVLGDLA
jgi:uncharacterized protein (DUF952 family)